MFLDEFVEIRCHNKTKKYYTNLGYNVNYPIGTKIVIKLKDLQPNSNLDVRIKCDRCQIELKASYQKYSRSLIHNCWKCGRKQSGDSLRVYRDTEYNCEDCNSSFILHSHTMKRRKQEGKHQMLCKSCLQKRLNTISKGNLKHFYGEEHPLWNPDKTNYQYYKSLVMNISEKNYSMFKHEINPNDYPRRLCGVEGGYQLDHIMSIKEGFDNGILPIIIGSKNNLQMLKWKENRAKWH